jgi:hypothetical protein
MAGAVEAEAEEGLMQTMFDENGMMMPQRGAFSELIGELLVERA